jgi:hypothetical protein
MVRLYVGRVSPLEISSARAVACHTSCHTSRHTDRMTTCPTDNPPLSLHYGPSVPPRVLYPISPPAHPPSI